jgi:hypothetical protein
MAIATWRHSVGDNSSNFFSAASYTLTWSIGNSGRPETAIEIKCKRVGKLESTIGSRADGTPAWSAARKARQRNTVFPAYKRREFRPADLSDQAD